MYRWFGREKTHEAMLETNDCTADDLKPIIEMFRKDPVLCYAQFPGQEHPRAPRAA
jgi:hypothetical protein